jgi:hypothetical protein
MEGKYSDLRLIVKTKSQRRFLDYVVSVTSLSHILNVSNLDLVGSLGWGLNPQHELDSLDVFLGKASMESVKKRMPLYVCSECGDLGCGAITVRMEWENECVVWKDFGFENGIDELNVGEFKHIGPFYFEKNQDEVAFEKLRSSLQCQLEMENKRV